MQGQRADVATQTSCVWDPGPLCVVLLKQCSSNLQLGGRKREQAHHKPPFLLSDKSFLMTTAIPASHDCGMHPSLQMLGAWASELGDEFSNRSTMLLLCLWAFNSFVRHLWSQDCIMEHRLMRCSLSKMIISTIYGQIKPLIHLHCYGRYRYLNATWKIDQHVPAGPVRPLVRPVSADPSIMIYFPIYTCRCSNFINAFCFMELRCSD